MRSSKPNLQIAPILNPDWLTPRWPAPAHVKAVFTTRHGGASVVPLLRPYDKYDRDGRYDSFNLGDHVGDQAEQVARNRQQLAQTLGAKPVYLKQVHGTDVVNLDAHTPDGTVADACITQGSNVACTIMVADCLPVLFTNLDGTFVAAAHAGWRGLAAGVLQRTIERIYMKNQAVSGVNNAYSAMNIIAWLGPCIGKNAFEVGDDVKTAFARQTPSAEAYFVALHDGKWLADLAGLARMQLQQWGIPLANLYGHDGSDAWCTVTQSQRFYSHRRDAATLGGSGRMAACVWLDGHESPDQNAKIAR
ncbi:MAG TPA: peptidoglycan editing factor PgeF [Burkholderiaceae bacterium]|nr:peptidoglycan editing factor PgeF [Burkholderiaceae bacterium]